MNRTKAFRRSLALLAIPPLAGLVVALSFPFLAVNAPSGGKVAVVEGWMDAGYMPDVRKVLEEGRYERIFITGTPRNFSYTLRHGDTVVVKLQRPVEGSLTVNACGGRDVSLEVRDASGVLLSSTVDSICFDRTVPLAVPCDELRFTPTYNGIPDPAWELLFILYAKINGVNIHALQRSVIIQRANGENVPGTTSHADACALALIKEGIPAHELERLPTVMLGDSRTWANAQRFAKEARAQGIKRVDVISFGIHSRRSRLTYQQACGDGVVVGVRCIEDRELQRGKWWRTPSGWMKVLKELAGVPASYLMEEIH